MDELSVAVHHDRGPAHLPCSARHEDAGDQRAVGQVPPHDPPPPRRQPAVREEQDDQREDQEARGPQLRDHHRRRAERQSPAMEVIVPDRVGGGVPVKGEYRAASQQQQTDPVAWLTPGNQQPENGNRKRGECEARTRLAGDAERDGEAQQDQHQGA